MYPEGAATAVLIRDRLRKNGLPDDHVVLFNTATGLKYPLPEVISRINKSNVDYSIF